MKIFDIQMLLNDRIQGTLMLKNKFVLLKSARPLRLGWGLGLLSVRTKVSAQNKFEHRSVISSLRNGAEEKSEWEKNR